MGHRLTLLSACVIAMAASVWPAYAQTVRSSAARTALEAFNRPTPETIDAFLTRLRPDPLDPSSRAQVMASLPEAELTPSRGELAKIAAAGRILDYSARTGFVMFKVIDLNCAFIGLYYRTAILVSRRQLAILDANEFAALAAHELGHDYDWNAYWSAMVGDDHARRQELELRADGLGALTLQRVGINPERLVSALQKTVRYNEGRVATANWEDYVPLAERIAFIRAVATLTWVAQPSVMAAAGAAPR